MSAIELKIGNHIHSLAIDQVANWKVSGEPRPFRAVNSRA